MTRELIIGRDVPWNASWSGESRYKIHLCRWTGRPYTSGGQQPAVCQANRPGDGRPVFAHPHMVRQRKSVAKMLCTVCGEPTPENDRWMFSMGERHMIQGVEAWLTTESPVHCRCADLAAEACPTLRKGGFKPARFPRRYAIIAQLVGGPELLKMTGLHVDPARPVVGHLKIALEPSAIRTAFGSELVAG
jgi:hypothetical protein